MTILFIKTIILSAALSVTLPLVNMEITFDKECELEEELWGEPGPLPVFNNRQNRNPVLDPIRYYGDSGDNLVTEFLRQASSSIGLVLSDQALTTNSNMPNNPNYAVQALTLISTNAHQSLTLEQQENIIKLYPRIRYLELVNINLAKEELPEFISHFHQLQRVNLRFIDDTTYNSSLRQAWAKLVKALKTSQTNQEELSSLLATINHELLKDSGTALDDLPFGEFSYFA